MEVKSDQYVSICGPAISSRIADAKVLVVGSGGIGCELLKNLALSGFKHVKVIDLDTIEMSNLNRQFLFRKQHIGLSKAVVAGAAIKEYSEDMDVDAEHANIMNPKFDLFFFRSFDIVFNALDNVKARQYVNSLCVLADVPLIEGGSTGLLGQSYPILPHTSECYNCRPRGGDEGEKYAVCTIRSTPDKLEHCIVWAKELFGLLFGDTANSLLFEEVDSVYMAKIRPTPAELAENARLTIFCRALLEALFDTETEKRLAIGSYATADQKPVVLKVMALLEHTFPATSLPATFEPDYETIWTPEEAIGVLLEELEWGFRNRLHEHPTVFNKDNRHHMRLVAAATKIAGNIIPALASTNAIVAGLQVISAVKLLALQGVERASQLQAMRYSYLLKVKTRRNRILQSATLLPPFETCLTCSSGTHGLLILDVRKAHFRGFLLEIVKGRLAFQAPVIAIGSHLIYEDPLEDSEEDSEGEERRDYTELYRTNLCALPGGGIQHGSLVTVTDGVTNQHATLTVYHQNLEDIEKQNEDGYIILNEECISRIIRTREEEETREEDREESDEEDISMEESDGGECAEIDPKEDRKRQEDQMQEENGKRAKL